MSEYDFDPMDDEGNNVRQGNQTWLGEGKHVVKLKDHELGEAQTGTPYIEIWIEDRDGKDHHERLSLHPNARWKLAGLFKAVGHTSKINLSQNGMVKKAIYNKWFQVTIGLGKPNDQGKQYREIKFFDPAPAGSAPPREERREEPREEPRGNGRAEPQNRSNGRQSNSGGYGGGGGYGQSRGEQPPPPEDDIPW